jgi:hypothetical protein
MKEKNQVFQMQFRHMFSRLEFKISLTAVLLVVAVSFIELCCHVYGLDRSQLYSAAYGWIGHPDFLNINIMQMFFVLFIFYIGSMAFSDSQFVDSRIRARDMIVTRCSRRSYILSGAAVSFLGAFLVIFVPFILSQLLSYVIFPVHGTVTGVFSDIPSSGLTAGRSPWKYERFYSLFTSLLDNHPLVYNLISIFYMSACAGALAVISFSTAFFIRRGRLLVIGIPAILVLIGDTLLPMNYAFSYYLYMGGMLHQTILMYLGLPIGALAVSGLLIAFKIHVLRDEL